MNTIELRELFRQRYEPCMQRLIATYPLTATLVIGVVLAIPLCLLAYWFSS